MDARGLREAAARARCLRQQHETTAGDPNVPPPPPPPPKNSRRSKGGENARAVAMGPLLAARLRPTGGGHTARTAGMRRTSRSRSIAATPLWIWPRCFPWRACALLPCTTGFTFWPPPQDAAAAAAPCPCLVRFPTACACHVPFYYLHCVLAAASPAPRPPPPMPGCAPIAGCSRNPSSAKCAQRHRPGSLRALLYVYFGGQLAGSCSACRR